MVWQIARLRALLAARPGSNNVSSKAVATKNDRSNGAVLHAEATHAAAPPAIKPHATKRALDTAATGEAAKRPRGRPPGSVNRKAAGNQ